MTKLYSLVWTGTLIVVGGLLIATRCYPDGTIDPDLMNLWIVWALTMTIINFLTCDLRYIVGIQVVLLGWLTFRMRFNRILFVRFLLVMSILLLLISKTSPFHLIIFVVLLYYLWQHDFDVKLPVTTFLPNTPSE